MVCRCKHPANLIVQWSQGSLDQANLCGGECDLAIAAGHDVKRSRFDYVSAPSRMCCWMSKSPIATSASFETWTFRSERPKTIQISQVAQGYAGYAMDTLAVVLAG